MGAMVGFVLGYVLGTRAGEGGWEELQESWHTISTSEEVRALLSGSLATAQELLRHGAGVVAERLSQGGGDPGLRSAA
jgi:hypothetical protein